MSIIIQDKPIDLTIVKRSYQAIKSLLGRTGIKTLYRELQSDNFVTGVSGWKLSAEGIIEALAAIISGDIKAGSLSFTKQYIFTSFSSIGISLF